MSDEEVQAVASEETPAEEVIEEGFEEGVVEEGEAVLQEDDAV